MKLNQLHIFLVLVLVSAGACKKDIIEIPESNTPVFKVEGTLDGENFSLVAGDDNVFMHTMTLEENGVEVFSGRIGGDNFSIEIGVFDGNIDFVGTTPQATTVLPVFSQINETPLTTLSKSAFDNAQNIEWVKWFINGNEVPDDYPMYEPGKFDVCAEVKFMDGSQDTMCDELIIGYNLNANCSLSASIGIGGMVTVTPVNATSQINFINWYVNDVFVGEALELESNFSTLLSTVRADIHFKNGVVRTKSIALNGYDYQKVINDFTMFEDESGSAVPQDFNIRVKIMRNGEELRSDYATNTTSKVHITAVENYGLNNAGYTVLKISGIISGKMMQLTTGEEIDLHMNIVFGVEVK